MHFPAWDLDETVLAAGAFVPHKANPKPMCDRIQNPVAGVET
jgi:hypothetical protein